MNLPNLVMLGHKMTSSNARGDQVGEGMDHGGALARKRKKKGYYNPFHFHRRFGMKNHYGYH